MKKTKVSIVNFDVAYLHTDGSLLVVYRKTNELTKKDDRWAILYKNVGVINRTDKTVYTNHAANLLVLLSAGAIRYWEPAIETGCPLSVQHNIKVGYFVISYYTGKFGKAEDIYLPDIPGLTHSGFCFAHGNQTFEELAVSGKFGAYDTNIAKVIE